MHSKGSVLGTCVQAEQGVPEGQLASHWRRGRLSGAGLGQGVVGLGSTSSRRTWAVGCMLNSALGAVAGSWDLGVGRIQVAGPVSMLQTPAGCQALPGSGCAARAVREETFPALFSHCLNGDTSSGTVFSGLFWLCSLKAVNTAG